MIKILIVFIIVSINNKCYSESMQFNKREKFIDSLYNNNSIREAIDSLDIWISNFDTTKTPKYQLGYFYSDRADCLKNLGLLNEALKNYDISRKFKQGYSIESDLSLENNIAYIYQFLGQNDTALSIFNNNLEIAKQNEQTDMIATIANNIGMTYSFTGMYFSAIEYYLESYKILDIVKDTLKISSILNNIGQLYLRLENLEEAEKYTLKCISLSKKIDMQTNIVIAYNNLGKIYTQKGDKYLAFKYLDSAMYTANAIEFYLAIPVITGNKGFAFLKFEQYDSAKMYIIKAIELNKKNESFNFLTKDYLNMASYYRKTKKYKEALKYYNYCINLGKQHSNLSDYYIAYKYKSETHKYLNDFKNAYSDFKIYIEISDSILNIRKQNEIFELEKKYNYQKKEKELILSKARIEKVKLSRAYISGGLVLILISLIFVYLQFLKKKKAYTVLYKKSIEAVKQEKKNNECRISLNRKQPDTDKQTKLYNNLIEVVEHNKVHHKKGLTLEDLAKNLTTNREYLSQIINEQFGRFNDFINHYRINDIVEILSDSDNIKSKYSLEVIAAEVGFNSMSTFIAAFKKETGLTPSKFRDSRK